MIEEKKGLHEVDGLQSSGIHVGLKTSKNEKDLGLLYFSEPVTVAGVFTQNAVKAWPVQDSQLKLKKQDHFQAIIVNSGNANACNGSQGQSALENVVGALSNQLDIPSESILMASTGIIGAPLDDQKIIGGLNSLVDSLQEESSSNFSEAILTTDTIEKQTTVSIEIDGESYSFTGAAKGSGMIHPRLGTMLAFIMTDINLSQAQLSDILQDSVKESFNRVSVDGDTSTNDTVLLCSTKKKELDLTIEKMNLIHSAIKKVCQNLAQMIIEDGEGATKFITVQVEGAASLVDADQVAQTISQSPLVKTAMFGEDPNFGRILAAVGYSGINQLNPNSIDIYFFSTKGEVQVCRDGQACSHDNSQAEHILTDTDLTIKVNLNMGQYKSWVWTSDLTYDYVKINAEYET